MTPKKQRALQALVSTASKAEASRKSGVGVGTLRRWLTEDPEFSAAYQDALDTMMVDALATGKKGMDVAMEALASIAADAEQNSQTRVSAASRLISSTLDVAEHVEIRRRLSDLERAVGEIEGRDPM